MKPASPIDISVNVAARLKRLRKRAGLSRDQLALEAGYKRTSSMQYYEMPERWVERSFPLDFINRIAPSLLGRGAPPIQPDEIFALCERASGVILSRARVVAIPLIEWASMSTHADNPAAAARLGLVEVPGLQAGAYIACELPDGHAASVAGKGAQAVIDIADRILREGEIYAIAIDTTARLRRYHANPPRFESLAFPPEPPLYHTAYIDVIGRLRAVTSFF
jgi:transcriptional regulator with XRE-family HTH domain